MTNEQLAELIQESITNRTEMQAELWERVRLLVYKICRKYYSSYSRAFLMRDIDIEDLFQESYSAFLKAIEAFDPKSEYKFTTYLNYPIKNLVLGLLGLRSLTNHSKSDPLNDAVSFETPINDLDTDRINIGSTFYDENAEKDIENVINRIENCNYMIVFEKAISRLEPIEQDIIKLNICYDLSLSKVADRCKLGLKEVHSIKAKAIRKLRKMPELRALYYQMQL